MLWIINTSQVPMDHSLFSDGGANNGGPHLKPHKRGPVKCSQQPPQFPLLPVVTRVGKRTYVTSSVFTLRHWGRGSFEMTTHLEQLHTVMFLPPPPTPATGLRGSEEEMSRNEVCACLTRSEITCSLITVQHTRQLYCKRVCM